jgi:hypothetical protein
MTTWVIKNEQDRNVLLSAISKRGLPFTAVLKKGEPRSPEQNRLQRMWMLEAEEQGDMTAEEYRAYCKLHFGVPILRAEDDDFKAVYDQVIRPLPYDAKLKLMQVPIDLPVTSRMTTGQKTRYLDQVRQFFEEQGFRLTQP